MELSHLRYFQTIAQSGSLTAAARVLKISQPTLTVAVQNLEEQLGTKLLPRGRSGVTLTSTGRELLRHAAEIFSLIERAEERILGLETDEVGSFTIGCHDLVLVELFEDAMDVFVASASLPDGEPLDVEAAHARLRAGPLVYAGRVPQCDDLISRLAAFGLLPTRLLSCGDLELVKSLTLEGIGVSLLPRRVAAYGQKGKLARLHPSLPFIPDTISLLYHVDLHRTRAALRLKDAMIAHGRGLGADFAS